MNDAALTVTVWDVGHGLAVWLKTPSGHSHWIDCGCETDFSPSQHVQSAHGVKGIDYLIISHPDADHLQDLPTFLETFGAPRVFTRNTTLPEAERYGSETLAFQQGLKQLDRTHTAPVPSGIEPWNPQYNGGVEVRSCSNAWSEVIQGNDTSVVAFYAFGGWLFVFPGDIEDKGWKALWAEKQSKFAPLIQAAKWKVLIAPHHGRTSGYSQSMMDTIMPQLTIVSDAAGQSETDRRFRETPPGLNLKVRPSTEARLVKFLSTKQKGRVAFEISESGSYTLHQYDYGQ